MEKKTFINKVKSLFSDVEKNTNEEVKFKSYETKDGVKVKIADDAELIEGTSIVVVDEEGNETPAPKGEHTIEDKTIVVDENGVISEVKEIETEDSEDKEEDIEEEMKKDDKEVEAKDKDKEVKAEEDEDGVKMMDEFKALKDAIVTMAENLALIQNEIAELKGKPADEEVKFSKATSNKKKSNTNDALLELAKYRRKK